MDGRATFCPDCRRHYEVDRHLCPRCGIHTALPTGALPQYGDVVDERFVRLGELGVGGMSVVYRAFDATRRREVALKLIRPKLSLRSDGVERFFREARLLKTLRHPNIVAPVAFGCTQSGTLYLAMELLVGEPLHDVVRRHGRLGQGRALALAQQAAEALATVHRTGILHRDLKPENFRVLPGDLLKMLDFGIATHLGESLPEDGQGMARQICGTPQYMSPERALGEAEDERSDLYGLGVLLFELLTGRPPFVGSSPVDVVRQHLCEPPPPLSDFLSTSDDDDSDGTILPAIESLVADLLRKEPSQRPDNAQQACERIRQARKALEVRLAEREQADQQAEPPVPFHERATLLLRAGAPAQRLTFPEFFDNDAPTLVGAVVLCGQCRALAERHHDACGNCGAALRHGVANPTTQASNPTAKAPSSAELLAATVGPDPRFAAAAESRPPRQPVVPARNVALVEARFETNAFGLRQSDEAVLQAWLQRTESLGGMVVLDDGESVRVAFGLRADAPPTLRRPTVCAVTAAWALVGPPRSGAGTADSDRKAPRVAVSTASVYLDAEGMAAPAWGLRGSALDVVSRLARSAEPGEVLLDSSSIEEVRHLTTLSDGRAIAARGFSGGMVLRPLAAAPQPALAAVWKASAEPAAQAQAPVGPPPPPAEARWNARSTARRLSVENEMVLC